MRYLNNAGTSYPKPQVVVNAVQETLVLPPSSWNAAYENAYESVRLEFPVPGRLLITSGCTAALALALGDFPWEPGASVVSSKLEHHALDRQLQVLESRRGVSCHRLTYRPGAPVDLEQLQVLLKRDNVGLVALTAASNITGERLPVAEIARLCRAHGTRLLVDAAQTFGTRAFEETALHADMIVAAGHKAALGPQGVGVFYARQDVVLSCPSAVCELGEDGSRPFPGFCDVGSVNLAGLVGLAKGLEFSREERSAIQDRLEGWAQEIRACLHSSPHFRLLGPGASQGVSVAHNPVVSFVPESRQLLGIEEEFFRRELLVRVGTHCAPSALRTLGAEEGCVRISLGAFNRVEDIAILAAMLENPG